MAGYPGTPVGIYSPLGSHQLKELWLNRNPCRPNEFPMFSREDDLQPQKREDFCEALLDAMAKVFPTLTLQPPTPYRAPKRETPENASLRPKHGLLGDPPRMRRYLIPPLHKVHSRRRELNTSAGLFKWIRGGSPKSPFFGLKNGIFRGFPFRGSVGGRGGCNCNHNVIMNCTSRWTSGFTISCAPYRIQNPSEPQNTPQNTPRILSRNHQNTRKLRKTYENRGFLHIFVIFGTLVSGFGVYYGILYRGHRRSQIWMWNQRRKKRTLPPLKENHLENFSGLKEKFPGLW